MEAEQKIVLLEPGEFNTLKGRSQANIVNLRKEFKQLQIIIKLANIHLTREKPAYEGGSWHVEGQLNESMQATSRS